MLVLFTLALPVLLGVMALGADFSIVYFNWAMAQKAADAAALAGASQLTGVTGSAASVRPAAVNYVNGYACLNGVTDPNNSSATICPSPANKLGLSVDQIVFTNVTDTQVSVGIKRTVPYFFGKMIGLQQASVAATATAAVDPVAGGNGMFPVGLQCTSPCQLSSLDPNQSFANGQSLTFGAKFVGGLANGNWQWLDVGQSNRGASSLGNAVQYGVQGNLSISDTVTSDPGNKGSSGPLKQGLDARLASCSAAKTPLTPATDPCQNNAAIGGTNGIGGTGTGAVPANDPCLVTMPVVDFTGCSGQCSLAVEGFAQIYLEQTSTTGTIDGCFVQGSTDATVGSAGAPNLGPLAPPILIN